MSDKPHASFGCQITHSTGLIDLKAVVQDIEAMLDAIENPTDQSKWSAAWKAVSDVIQKGGTVWTGLFGQMQKTAQTSPEAMVETCKELRKCCQNAKNPSPMMMGVDWLALVGAVIQALITGYLKPTPSPSPAPNPAPAGS